MSDSVIGLKFFTVISQKTIGKIYLKTGNSAIRKSQLCSEIFLETCPYSLLEVLNSDWLP